jgi:AcrR family transcriptional regulator
MAGGEVVKTIKQVADALGVSRQAVYRRLSALPSGMLSVDEKGIQRISSDGEAFLKTLLSEHPVRELSAGVHKEADSSPDKVVDALLKQLEVKDKQIEELTAAVKSLSDSINAARQNELAETVLNGSDILSIHATREGGDKKAGFWSRLFKGKN